MCTGVDRAKETYEGLYYPPPPAALASPSHWLSTSRSQGRGAYWRP